MTASWQQSHVLNNVDFELSPGELLTVIGPVGGGKSSLLLALLSELPLSGGDAKIEGKLAYTAQQAWVFSATVRQNILFGRPYDESRYKRVVKAAALEMDFKLFPDGDLTYVGERGVSLSGGQKARIGLARAVYIDADIYLLDDPLSAVDPTVSRHLFEKCICGILKDKIRILVTHQLQYIEQADKILILSEGNVLGYGSYGELLKSGMDFAALLHHEVLDEKKEQLTPSPPFSPKIQLNGNLLSQSCDLHSISFDETPKPSFAQSLRNLHHSHKHIPLLTKRHKRSHKSESNLTHIKATSLVHLSAVENPHTTLQSMLSLNSVVDNNEEPVDPKHPEEHKDVGSVGIMVYVRYFWAGGGVVGIFLFFTLNILAQGLYILTDWWLSYWTEYEKQRSDILIEYEQSLEDYNSTNGTMNATVPPTPDVPTVPLNKYVYIYSGLVCSVFISGFIRAIVMFRLMVRCSQKIHLSMFQAVIRSPILFFDTNPIGRILNRFSKDTGLMDEQLPITFYDFTQCALNVIGIILVAGIINPYVFIPTIPLVILFLLIRKVFLATSRDVKRIESTARSPVFSHLSTTLNGIHTIRSLEAQQSFLNVFYNYQDLHTEAWYMFLTINRWFAVRLDWLCVLFICATAFLCVLLADNLSGGLVGLTLTYSIGLMGLFQWAVRQSAEVENQMVSVERVLEYTKLPPEAALDRDDAMHEGWPEHGSIIAKNVTFRYAADQSPVLHDINFEIKSKEKIGIVGRTGAGKSSMVAMLFRLAEPEGTVCIDGVDTKSLGLHQLRGCMSIIPQDPMLFCGTVKKNLDPFESYKEDELWKALDEVELKGVIQDLPEGLEAEISEGGENFSVGQRQLLCLCRAVLRKVKILVIDEATANVDPRTDSLIQKTLRNTFRDCTVLTIAHRLNTIVDSDRIMVLDAGKVVEFDVPYLLLQDSSSCFSSMLNETGTAQSEQLYFIAKQFYLNKQNGGEKEEKADSTKEVVNDSLNLNHQSSQQDTASEKDPLV